ncbi:hypothetical protein [Paraburkholderia sp. J10-1]|uniref:hypothetical protein n=1 Tax=Paraburkholderia sp. J10-1 TaxID=2805430 RepID=UPI002AB6BB6F|nr:hypothetical protein [Paraburkholderia sp. J10-1]
MQANQTPAFMPVPFALNGQRNDIPEASQISVTKGAASLNDGFPPLTMTSPLQGGIPPFGKDMNGVLYLFAQTLRWVQAGGSFVYDAAFANDPAVGGYPKGAVLLNAALSGFWINTVDNNATDPDATDANDPNAAQGWLPLNADWNATGGAGQILNKPNLAKVATSGQYDDLQGKPDLAPVATSGSYTDLIDTPTIPPEYALPPATTTTLGGIIAGPGTSIAADGTLTASGLVKTVNTNSPDGKGNVSVFVKNAKGTSSQYVGLVAFQGGSGDPLICMMQGAGVGTSVFWNGEAVEVDLLPASKASLGGIIAGPGTTIAPDGTLCASGTAIVNLTSAAAVALDLTPIVQGAPEILFNLTAQPGLSTILTIVNPPPAGTLAEFVFAVTNAAGSGMTWPSNLRWPQGVAPTLTGVAGKIDTFVIYTQDGGVTYDGFVSGQNQ